ASESRRPLGLGMPSRVVGAPLAGSAVDSAAAVAAMFNPRTGSGQALCVDHVKTFLLAACRGGTLRVSRGQRHTSVTPSAVTLNPGLQGKVEAVPFDPGR